MKKGIIIGASSGIGWELAIQLAARLSVRSNGETSCGNRLEVAAKLSGQHFVQGTDLRNVEPRLGKT